jgi:hypothetical protein
VYFVDVLGFSLVLCVAVLQLINLTMASWGETCSVQIIGRDK